MLFRFHFYIEPDIPLSLLSDIGNIGFFLEKGEVISGVCIYMHTSGRFRILVNVI